MGAVSPGGGARGKIMESLSPKGFILWGAGLYSFGVDSQTVFRPHCFQDRNMREKVKEES